MGNLLHFIAYLIGQGKDGKANIIRFRFQISISVLISHKGLFNKMTNLFNAIQRPAKYSCDRDRQPPHRTHNGQRQRARPKGQKSRQVPRVAPGYRSRDDLFARRKDAGQTIDIVSNGRMVEGFQMTCVDGGGFVFRLAQGFLHHETHHRGRWHFGVSRRSCLDRLGDIGGQRMRSCQARVRESVGVHGNQLEQVVRARGGVGSNVGHDINGETPADFHGQRPHAPGFPKASVGRVGAKDEQQTQKASHERMAQQGNRSPLPKMVDGGDHGTDRGGKQQMILDASEDVGSVDRRKATKPIFAAVAVARFDGGTICDVQRCADKGAGGGGGSGSHGGCGCGYCCGVVGRLLGCFGIV